VALEGVKAARVSGQIITAAAMNAHNDFNAPNVVAPAPFRVPAWRAGR
jgi:alpha-N-arabinofuranosidase